jgi:hypothetical protein
VFGDGLVAEFGQLLPDAYRVFNGPVRFPLIRGHRLGDLQPLRGGVDQRSQRILTVARSRRPQRHQAGGHNTTKQDGGDATGTRAAGHNDDSGVLPAL